MVIARITGLPKLAKAKGVNGFPTPLGHGIQSWHQMVNSNPMPPQNN
jgi:hypothetical protein